jgi:polysaccharide biosynthesis/export protein
MMISVFKRFSMHEGGQGMSRVWLCLVVLVAVGALNLSAQSTGPSNQTILTAGINNTKMETTDDWNRRLESLVHSALSSAQNRPSPGDYRIGPDDLLRITVFDAPDLSQPVRVSGDGEISLPLLGTIKAAGLTPRELELVLQALLRRTYMKDPQVTVTITEMQSHSVSVLGAVNKPGVFQIRGTKTLLEMLSMAEGLAPEAGDAVLVMRGGGTVMGSAPALPANTEKTGNTKISAVKELLTSSSVTSSGNSENGQTVEINLKLLLDSGDPKYNVPVYPGDIVKVKAAGIVYVVGDVKQPGGFPLKDNGHITVLQAIALGQGMAPTASKKKATIIRTAQNGQETEIPIDIGKILSGKAPDLPLRPKDILYVPKSGAKTAGHAALDTFTRYVIWRGIP